MANLVRFDTPYQNFAKETIFATDPQQKLLRPISSGDAFTGAGFQFGQEEVRTPDTFAGFQVGPNINTSQELTTLFNPPPVDATKPIPTSTLQAPSTQSDIMSLLNKNITKQDELFGQIQSFFTPSPEEQVASDQVNKFQTQADMTQLGAQAGINQAEDRFAPITAIRGEQSAIERRANLQLQTIGVQQQAALRTLQSAQSNRQAKLEAAKFLYDANRNNLKDTLELYKATAPENIKLQIDEATGQAVAVTRNPLTGQVSTVPAGNVKTAAPFYNYEGTFFRSADGKGYPTPEAFFADADVSTFEEAYAKGIVSDIVPSVGKGATSDITEYNLAKKEGFAGTFEDWLRINANLKAKASGGSGFGGILTPYQEFQGIQSLSAQYNRNITASKEVVRYAQLMNEAFNRLDRGETKDLNATTQAIIISFNKISDPNSVVRESEYARSPEGQSLLATLEGKLNALVQGGPGLTKASLKEFTTLASLFSQNASNSIAAEANRVRSVAQAYGLNPDLIAPTSSTQPVQPTGQADEPPTNIDLSDIPY